MPANLPPECLAEIFDYLRPAEAAAFSLSCKIAYYKLRDKYIPTLVPSDKLALLKLIALDFPDEIACPKCLRLHDMANATLYSFGAPEDKERQCRALRKCDVESFAHGYNRPFGGFSITIFAMAMKRHQEKAECEDLLKLLSRNPPIPKIDFENGIIKQKRVDCKIFNGNMIHRVQQSFLLCNPTWCMLLFKEQTPRLLSFDICEHLKIKFDSKNARIMREGSEICFKTNCHIPETLNRPPSKTSGVLSCHSCPTECRLDAEYHESRGGVVTVTKWANLGSGPESLWFGVRGRFGIPSYTIGIEYDSGCPAFKDDEDSGGEISLLSSDENKARLFQAQDDRAPAS
ncbi:hypothetical protein NHQ30_003544 [Ciborinia camelliae]|nr:hypothetical protein NHQ30_003544 [Ciborinia camelliae]